MSAPALAQPPAAENRYDPELIERLRMVIDPERMRRALEEQWPYLRSTDARLVGCETARVYPRGAEGFVITYDVRLRDGKGEWLESLHGELVPQGAEAHYRAVLERLRKSRRKQIFRSRPNDRIAYLANIGLVLRFPGYDESLDGLKLLHRPKDAAAFLAEQLAPGPHRLSGVTAELLGHRLGKRCVLRFRFDARNGGSFEPEFRSVIAKLFKPGTARARRADSLARALWREGLDDRSGVRVPRPLGYVETYELALMEDVPGTPLPLLAGVASTCGMTAAGHALAKLQGCSLRLDDRYTVQNEISLLEGWVSLAGLVHPALTGTLTDAFATVHARLSRCQDFQPCILHRDYHEKQVLIDGDRTVLIDFDTLCRGDPALDVGNFLAHLRLAALQTVSDSISSEEAFLAGYGLADSLDFRRRMDAYLGSTLLRLACLYSFSTRWRHLAEPLLRGVT